MKHLSKLYLKGYWRKDSRIIGESVLLQRYVSGWWMLVQKGEDKVRPRTCHEGPERSIGISTLSLTSALDAGGWSTPHPGRFIPGKQTRYHCTGGCVGLETGLDGCGKSCPHRDSMHGPSSPWRVVIPTEPSRPTDCWYRPDEIRWSRNVFLSCGRS
jgi:hypothetical protein